MYVCMYVLMYNSFLVNNTLMNDDDDDDDDNKLKICFFVTRGIRLFTYPLCVPLPRAEGKGVKGHTEGT